MTATSLQDLATQLDGWRHHASFATHVDATLHVVLPGNEVPWRSTGLLLAAGQQYTVFASGKIQWSRRVPTLYGGPRFHLWTRIAGGGDISNLRRDNDTFSADHGGLLELGLYMGMWKNAQGELASDAAAYARLEGSIEVLVIAWKGDAASGLAAVHALAPSYPQIEQEREHLAEPRPTPPGWTYLVEAGQAEIYATAQDDHGHDCIHLAGRDDQGILVRPVDFLLSPDTRLTWRWRVDKHPSRVPEDTPYTHDYVSVAAEFEDGRDLTWIWSSSLAPGHHFPCPIKPWSARETHLVVRSGSADFGHWVAESRPVLADVATAVGTTPARVVRLWLIVVATFQHAEFDARIADLRLTDGAREIRVFPA